MPGHSKRIETGYFLSLSGTASPEVSLAQLPSRAAATDIMIVFFICAFVFSMRNGGYPAGFSTMHSTELSCGVTVSL